MILVTGGLGFIGSNFVRMALMNQLNDLDTSSILVLDSATYASDRNNLKEFIGCQSLKIVEGDICNAKIVDELVKEVSSIVHFAAESHVDRSIVDPDIFVRTNVLGTFNLLRAAEKYGRRILYVSTDEVYGSLDNTEATEDYPLRPSSPYSSTKAAGDLLCLAYYKTYGADVVITRSANNYGRNQNQEKLIPTMISAISRNLPIPIYGDGKNVRNWIHVEDHCRGIAKALFDGRSGEIYNFGTDEYFENIELCKLFLNFKKVSDSVIQFRPDRKGHDLRYGVSSEKAKRELDWKPKISLSESLGDLFTWYS